MNSPYATDTDWPVTALKVCVSISRAVCDFGARETSFAAESDARARYSCYFKVGLSHVVVSRPLGMLAETPCGKGDHGRARPEDEQQPDASFVPLAVDENRL